MKVLYNKLDTKEEKKCKKIFNNNTFGLFRNNYEKFREYSILIKSYEKMLYKSEMYRFNFIKENYPNFINI